MSALFVTGATGFVGRRVARALARDGHEDVRLLTRHPERMPSIRAGWSVVSGDLARPAEWSARLEGVDTVVHLAASTGKVRKGVHVDAIVGGTERLLDAARTAGVSRFMFVSSVAAGFANRRYYPYADAKAAAEALVRESAFDWLIVRPTMVFGPDSPVLRGLRKLAMLPLPLIFGSGTEPVEPIFVDDLAAMLVAALGVRPWGGKTITLGGPERVTTEELLGRLRAMGNAPGLRARFIHLPLPLFREALGTIEPLLFPLMPLTAGQLATFANPSVGDRDAFVAQLPAPTIGIDEMLAASVHAD
ncbi:MAG: NAD(P)H-binding protein [bacterium]